ncbi:MBL fold metallo-hydrolase [Microlunatus ginsengisoli]|uniref:MBL fold metallo-hydrolase n=1 Tax=Microlunatus ginsengisoli TaxID=363863 RepID=A0ABP6ZC24_9ACTN
MTASDVSRRGLLGASAAVAAAGLAGVSAPAEAHPRSDPRHPALPVGSNQPRSTQLILLGTSGGPPPDYVRTGISSVLTVGGRNYVIDAGRSSVTQYLNAGLLFANLEAIFITHQHADHLADYYNYFLLGGNVTNDSNDNLSGPVHVYGPGPAGALPPPVSPPADTVAPQNPTPGISDLTARLTEGYAYSHNIFIRETAIRDVRTLIDVHDVLPPASAGASALGDTAPPMAPFDVFEDDRVRVSAILVPHGPVFPSFAYRFDTDDGSVVFSGDTRASDNVVRLAHRADFLVHEVLDLEFYEQLGVPAPLLEHFKVGHTLTTEIGALAQRAHVRTLVLSHLVPSNPKWVSDAEYRRKCQQGFGGTVHVGNDLDRLPIRRRRR